MPFDISYCKISLVDNLLNQKQWEEILDIRKHNLLSLEDNFGPAKVGIERIAPFRRTHRPFYQARAFIHHLKLKNYKEWTIYRKSGKKPDDIPSNPNKTYKNQGWSGYKDWLGA